jgi:long-chain acyl-CoA synthetase
MAHVGERFLVEMGVLYTGGEVYFAESIESFQKNLQEAEPTIMLGVHRIWKKFQDGILSRMPQKKLDRLLRIPLVSSLIKKTIRKKLGLHKARIMFTAASPTPPELLEWFDRLGIHIVEAYSMTENFAYSHSNLPGKNRIGWVGIPLPHNEVRLGPDGEVQCRSKAVMLGYYKDPALTRATITDDGFLCTGDEGIIDDGGYLRITGRTKDIFKTSKGKYVVPSPIEMNLSACSDLEFSCITGANLPQPIALVTLSEGGRLKPAAALRSTLEQLMDALNAELDSHQRIAKVVVVPDQWLPDNDLLTPTFKLKRREIESKYAAHYQTWNEAAEQVIFAGA